MNNLTNFQNDDIVKYNENLYLYFKINDCKYAVSTQQVVEILKLPLLDYPQKLSNNFVGILNYNNLTINIMDIRFYLDMKVTPYSASNQLLIVKTDEAIFGLIIDSVEDIISLEQAQIEYLSYQEGEKLIEFLYKQENETISIINLFSLENLIKKGVPSKDVDIASLFPQDEDSHEKLLKRNWALIERYKSNLAQNIFSQNKFISFSLNNNTYCITLKYVKEFLRDAAITPIPCTPDYIEGVITLRGNFVTVINIKKLLNIEYDPTYNNAESKKNVIIIKTSDFKIGFLVDEIFDMIDISDEIVEHNSHNQLNKFIESEVVLEDNLYTILDIKNILSDEKFFIEEKF